MRHPNDNGFQARRTAAAEAKRTLLEKFASAPKVIDPQMRERLAAREAVAIARDLRRAERQAMKVAEHERMLADAQARAAAAAAEEADAAKTGQDDEAARKAERDRRYAARKARRS
ncbi:DUF6481 family protein [Ciceribacter azotifigens]|uniref:DUF6481 family protein n=1 Tax=Ciceribacter azotifigens TaxID=2069303 RepID=UPI003A8A7787